MKVKIIDCRVDGELSSGDDDSSPCFKPPRVRRKEKYEFDEPKGSQNDTQINLNINLPVEKDVPLCTAEGTNTEKTQIQFEDIPEFEGTSDADRILFERITEEACANYT
jgi:hypothetical protein